MSPTIVMKDGEPFLAIGTPGGQGIWQTVPQALMNIIDFDMNIQEAVNAARVHHQWLPDTLQFEETWTQDGVIESMEARGHVTGRRATVGVVQVVEVLPGGAKRPASDPRKGGVPDGF